MTIQEAIKSGKPFARPENPWIYHIGFRMFDINEIIADDWEVLVCETHQVIWDHAWPGGYKCLDCRDEAKLAASKVKELAMGNCGDDCKDPNGCSCIPTVDEAMNDLEKALVDSFEQKPPHLAECQCPECSKKEKLGSCIHHWEKYQGLHEEYQYCTKCNAKKEKK